MQFVENNHGALGFECVGLIHGDSLRALDDEKI
jgi:hypothetical protein